VSRARTVTGTRTLQERRAVEESPLPRVCNIHVEKRKDKKKKKMEQLELSINEKGSNRTGADLAICFKNTFLSCRITSKLLPFECLTFTTQPDALYYVIVSKEALR